MQDFTSLSSFLLANGSDNITCSKQDKEPLQPEALLWGRVPAAQSCCLHLPVSPFQGGGGESVAPGGRRAWFYSAYWPKAELCARANISLSGTPQLLLLKVCPCLVGGWGTGPPALPSLLPLPFLAGPKGLKPQAHCQGGSEGRPGHGVCGHKVPPLSPLGRGGGWLCGSLMLHPASGAWQTTRCMARKPT